MSAYRTQQHRLVHRGLSYHFVSYQGQPADEAKQQPEVPASWYLMLAGKRWMVGPQVEATAEDLDRQFAAWLDAHVLNNGPQLQSQQPPMPVAPARTWPLVETD